VGARILIIEDNATNMELMAYLLTAFGHTPLMAADGEAGVALALATLPDLILCDVHLPKLDGMGVVAALRAHPATARSTVLAVTALAMLGDRERLLAAGFDGYVAKPIEPEQFVGQLAPFLPGGAHNAAAGDTILLVDDDAFMLELLEDLLDGEGYRILTAASAADAVALLQAHQVALIVCDQCMPLTTGAAFFERARQLAPACYRIMLTAAEETPDLALSAERGDIDRRMAKPFDGAELRQAVRDGLRAAAARAQAL
jgi:two-component system cell cycle response regulator